MSRRRLSLVLAGALGLCGGVASAVCPTPGTLAPNALYISNTAPVIDRQYVFTVSRPYWVAFAAIAHNPYNNDDYDVGVYGSRTGGTPPVCLTGLLANSLDLPPVTDFVVGDFNQNPYGTYYAHVHCAAGSCDGELPTWRDGDVLTVDGPALASTSSTATTGDDVIHVRDVLLVAGRTYYLNFEKNDGLAWKMLLFRNTNDGVYWAGRSQAQLETDHCATYVAPSTGYYGLVVVNDSRPSTATGSFKVSVTTKPTCGCPPLLADGVGVTVPGPAIDSRLISLDAEAWNAVGVRSTGDWDLETADLAGGFPNALCAGTSRASSSAPGPGTEVIVSDGWARAVPDDAHVTPYSFVSSDPATVQWAKAAGVPFKAFKIDGLMGGNDVLRIAEVPYELLQGTTPSIHLSLHAVGTSARALVFRRGFADPVDLPKASAVASIADTGTVNFAPGDRGAVVLVHEDGASGWVTLEAGRCEPPAVPGRNQNVYLVTDARLEFDPPDTTWCVVAGRGQDPGKDVDLRLYGAATGPGYPDCYGAPGALSAQGPDVTDFIVGDFHSMPRGRVRARLYDYVMNPSDAVVELVQWRQAGDLIKVNGPAVLDSLAYRVGGNVAAIHEVKMYAGLPYTINFVPSPEGNEAVHLFGNSGGGTYWAPRSAELLATSASAAFTPAFTGTYALVVTSDGGSQGGLVRLSVTSPIAGVGSEVPATTRIARLGPNPTRGALRLEIEAARAGDGRLELLDVAGRAVASAELGHLEPGTRSVTWRLDDLGGAPVAPGLYFARLWLGREIAHTQRITVMR